MVTYMFTVEGMHCGSCGMLIDETLEDLNGVLRASTSLRTRRSIVEADPVKCQPEDVIAAITTAGYTAREVPVA
ncbi:MAG: heavy metal transporter [Streptosporangiales bacterium]|nr:heavy metal transporter [Streptosporangiales bacterium]